MNFNCVFTFKHELILLINFRYLSNTLTRPNNGYNSIFSKESHKLCISMLKQNRKRNKFMIFSDFESDFSLPFIEFPHERFFENGRIH